MNLGLSIYSVQNPNGIWNHLKDKEFLYVELYALNSSEEKVLEDSFDISNLFLKIKIKELELEVIDFKHLISASKCRNILNGITVSLQDKSNSVEITYFSENYSDNMRPLSLTFLDKLQFLKAYKFFNTFSRYINIEKKCYQLGGGSQFPLTRSNTNSYFKNSNNSANSFSQLDSQFSHIRNNFSENQRICESQQFCEPNIEAQLTPFDMNQKFVSSNFLASTTEKGVSSSFYQINSERLHESNFDDTTIDCTKKPNEITKNVSIPNNLESGARLFKEGKNQIFEFLSKPLKEDVAFENLDEELELCKEITRILEDSDFKKLYQKSANLLSCFDFVKE